MFSYPKDDKTVNVMIVEKAYPRNGFTNGKSFKLVFVDTEAKTLENMFGAMHRQQVFWIDVAATVFLIMMTE
ncbi:hypothetical protein ACSBR2_000984 [Camellia fascicularis]